MICVRMSRQLVQNIYYYFLLRIMIAKYHLFNSFILRIRVSPNMLSIMRAVILQRAENEFQTLSVGNKTAQAAGEN